MLIPPSITFTGNKQMAVSLKSRAIKFYNFIANQAEMGGVSYVSRSLPLEDGSYIKITSYKEGNYGLRTGSIVVFGKVNIITKLKNKVQVCWRKVIGSEFIGSKLSIDGTTLVVVRKQEDAYKSATANRDISSHYWVNGSFTDALSVEVDRIYYGGKSYIKDASFNPLIITYLKAMYLGKTLILLYKHHLYDDFFLTTGKLESGKLSATGLPTNASELVGDNGIIFAGFGGDSLLWTISRGGPNSEAFLSSTELFVRCYRVKNDIDTGINLTLLAEKQYESKKEQVRSTQVIANITGSFTVNPPAHTEGNTKWSGQYNIIGDDKHKIHSYNEQITNVVQDVFIQGSSISIAFQSSSWVELREVRDYTPSFIIEDYITETLVTDGPNYVQTIYAQLGGQFTKPWFHALRDSTVTKSTTLRADKLELIKVGEAYQLEVSEKFSQAHTLNYHEIYDAAQYNRNGISTTTTTYVAPGPSESTIEENVTQEAAPYPTQIYPPSFSQNPTWQYADGINGVYSVLNTTSDFPGGTEAIGSTRTRWSTVEGVYGSYNSPSVVTTTAFTSGGPHTDGYASGFNWSPLNWIINSNPIAVYSKQGTWGAYDGKTYIVQRFNNQPPTSYWTVFAFVFGPGHTPVKLIEQDIDYRPLTLGKI